MQMGHAPADRVGKPVIAIVNTWSDGNPCRAFEDSARKKALEGRSILGLYPLPEVQSRTDFAAWRRAKGR